MATAKKDSKAPAKDQKTGVEVHEYDAEEAFLKETAGGNTTLSDTLVAALRVKFTDSERVTPVKIVGDVLTEPNAEQKRAGFLNPSEAPTEMRDGTLSNTGYKKSDAANEDDPEGSQAVEDDDAANVEPDAPKGQFSGQ